MKFFLDTANLEEIKKVAAWGIIDGVTTNPSLIATEGIAIEEQIRKICDLIDGEISAEVVSVSAKEMIDEACRLAKVHRNIIVKLPLNQDGIIAFPRVKRKAFAPTSLYASVRPRL